MNRQNYSRLDKIRLSQKMIENPTDAEAALYSAISRLGIKFKKQYMVCGYIVDAFIEETKTAIECDGGYHTSLKQQFYDINRDSALKKTGITTIRFTNEQILKDPLGLVKSIKKRITTKKKIKKPKRKKYVLTQDQIASKIKRTVDYNHLVKLSSMSSSQFAALK